MNRYAILCAGLLASWLPGPAAGRQLSVYISADMEGVAAISETDDPLARRLMTLEVNAAVAGAYDAGATRVVVNDAHGSHNNLIQDLLDPRVTLIRGSLKPYGMMQGLDASFQAVVFIGFHGKAGSAGSFAAHTGSGAVGDLRVNGLSVGEGGMNALYASWYRVPVAFISGDDVAVTQLQEVSPHAHGVSVKDGIWNSAVVSMSPDSARAAIRRGVTASLASLAAAPTHPGPYRVELQYTSPLRADIAEGIPGVRRVDHWTVGFVVEDYPAAYRMIRVLYKHLTSE